MKGRIVLAFNKMERSLSILMVGSVGVWVSEKLRTEDDFIAALEILEEEEILTPDSSLNLMDAAGSLDLPEGEASSTLKEGKLSFCRTRQSIPGVSGVALPPTFLVSQPRCQM